MKSTERAACIIAESSLTHPAGLHLQSQQEAQQCWIRLFFMSLSVKAEDEATYPRSDCSETSQLLNSMAKIFHDLCVPSIHATIPIFSSLSLTVLTAFCCYDLQ